TQPGPVRPSHARVQPLDAREVQITGGYWHHLQELNGTVVIAHALAWMERVGWIDNFDAAREGRLPADRTGREFSDSEVYKLLEAMAWEIARTAGTAGTTSTTSTAGSHASTADSLSTAGAALEEQFNAVVDRIAAAQEPDGYLNTNFGRPGQEPRYSQMEWGHELYCYGHLIQAAVARGRTHGCDTLG